MTGQEALLSKESGGDPVGIRWLTKQSARLWVSQVKQQQDLIKHKIIAIEDTLEGVPLGKNRMGAHAMDTKG